MSISDLYLIESFDELIDDTKTNCKFTMMNSGITSIEFLYRKEEYRFTLFTTGKLLNKVLRKYFEEFKSDTFGTVDEYDDQLNVTMENKKSFAIKVAKDFIKCLSNIIVSQGRHLIDYAVFFLEKKIDDSYSNFIQISVCNFIVHQHFLSGAAKFTVVDWKASDV